MLAGLEHVAPAVGAYNRLDEGDVDAARARDPRRHIGGGHDLLATTLVAQCDGYVDRDRPAVSAERRAA